MTLVNSNEIKYKLMSEDDLFISLDRLTRFKNPEIKYKRVFFDVILKHLSYPSVSKHKLNEMPPDFIVKTVETIWNESVESLFGKAKEKFFVSDTDAVTFEINDEFTKLLMSAQLNIAPIIKNLSEYTDVENLRYIKYLYESYSKESDLSQLSEIIRKQKQTLFPIKKLILTEGITEETLLPVFGKYCGFDFNQNGVYILATGGKSKVLSLYAEFKYILRIPMLVLLDNDAKPVYEDIKSVLRKNDSAYLINSGEFEDILPKELIIKTLNANYDCIPVTKEDICKDTNTCEILDLIYKEKGLGEFRKAHFAKAAAECISEEIPFSGEILSVIDLVKRL